MKKLSMLLMFVLSLAIASPCVYAQKLTKDQKKAAKTIKKDSKNLPMNLNISKLPNVRK